MAFRDDLDAAQARADALARELAEREETLARTQRELADARSDNDARHKESQQVAQAQGQLDGMVARAAARSKVERLVAAKKAQATRNKVEEARLRRMLRSTSRGHSPLVIVAAIGTVLGAVATRVAWEHSWLLVLLMALVTLALGLACARLQQGHDRECLVAEFEWAAMRPYQLTNYPDLLVRRPPRSDNHDRTGHSKLTLELGFREEIPAELGTLVRAFDPALECVEPGIYRRRSQVSEEDESANTRDTNVEVATWVHSCERDLLEPLHKAYGLRFVRFDLG